MKLKMVLLTVICLLTLLITHFCSNKASNIDDSGKFFIRSKETPQWISAEIEKIACNTPLFKPIKVFIIQDDGIEYIAIENHDKNSPAKLKVFLCSGVPVEAHEEKYVLIEEKYNKKEGQLIWPE